jgi:uncharacterized protein YjbI with pentapeptide repeats
VSRSSGSVGSLSQALLLAVDLLRVGAELSEDGTARSECRGSTRSAALQRKTLAGALIASLQRAGLGLVGARLVRARLLGGVATGARSIINRARLLGARLLGARLLGARLLGARLLGARTIIARTRGIITRTRDVSTILHLDHVGVAATASAMTQALLDLLSDELANPRGFLSLLDFFAINHGSLHDLLLNHLLEASGE